MTKMVKAAKVISKVVEVFHWVGAVLMLAATICALAAPGWVQYFVGIDAKDCCGAELNVYGFEIVAPVTNGRVDQMPLFLFGIGAVIILAIMAMIFRNLYLIIKRSGESTPFQTDNIRMLKEIGYFAISVPVIGFVMSIVCRLVLGVEAIETNVNLYGVSMGIIILALTQFFVHGVELEKDVDGLL